MEVAKEDSEAKKPEQPKAQEPQEKPKSAKGGKKPATQAAAPPAKEIPAHKAILIIASPEGGAIKYELVGVATEPILDGYIYNAKDTTQGG